MVGILIHINYYVVIKLNIVQILNISFNTHCLFVSFDFENYLVLIILNIEQVLDNIGINYITNL